MIGCKDSDEPDDVVVLREHSHHRNLAQDTLLDAKVDEILVGDRGSLHRDADAAGPVRRVIHVAVRSAADPNVPIVEGPDILVVRRRINVVDDRGWRGLADAPMPRGGSPHQRRVMRKNLGGWGDVEGETWRWVENT